MTPVPGERGWWLLVAAYAVCLLGVQSVLGIAVDAFKERWGAAALDTTATVGVLLAGVAVAALLGVVWRGCTAGERAWLAAMLVLYAAGALSLEIPQERLHYAEYGLLAGLVYVGRAAGSAVVGPARLAAPEGAGLRRAMAVAVLATAGVGLLDELLQEWLWTRRYFDWRDVRLNLQAALLGVAAMVPAFAGWRRRASRGPGR